MTEPAPLHGTPDPAAPGVIVVYRDGTDADAVTAELAAAHGFTPRHVFSSLPGFAAELADDALATVRRHPAVKYVEYDRPVRMM